MDDYEQWIQDFEWDIPEDYTIAKAVDEHAKDPDKVAVYWEDDQGNERTITYQELRDEANRLANALIDRGIEKGHRIMVVLPRLPEVFFTQIGAFKIGAIIVPCPEMLREKNIEYRSTNCEATTIVASPSAAEHVDNVRGRTPLKNCIIVGGNRDGWQRYSDLVSNASPDLEPQDVTAKDIMTINYTSGTTGDPKGVLHDHKWMYCFLKTNARYWWDAHPDEVLWSTTSPGWAKWFWSPLGVAVTVGASQVTYKGRFDAEKFLHLMEKYEVNKLCATPTEYRMWAQEDLEAYDLSKMTTFLSAGEALNREVIERFKRAYGLQIHDGYGQTESSGLVCNYAGIEVRYGSMGKPMPGSGVTIVDEDGTELPPGKIGQIAVPIDHPGLMVGYWDGDDLEELAVNGWYLTGDLAKKDDDGYFWFKGRADDVIKASGYRIGPFEVEDALVKHPAVVEAAVVASPHEIRGNIVKAYVVLATGYDASQELIKELQQFVKEETAPYKYPREIEFVDELPKTISGKIRRVELRERERKMKGS